MRALYFALAIVLLVVADMTVAGPCAKGQRPCNHYGGTCGTHCLKTGHYYATCDCGHGTVCCLPHRKG